jgi:hypothetical protein
VLRPPAESAGRLSKRFAAGLDSSVREQQSVAKAPPTLDYGLSVGVDSLPRSKGSPEVASRAAVPRSRPAGLGCMDGCRHDGSSSNPYRSMEGGSVDELLDMTVERPVLDQLQVEVGRPLEDRVQPGLTGDDREERHLHIID